MKIKRILLGGIISILPFFNIVNADSLTLVDSKWRYPLWTGSDNLGYSLEIREDNSYTTNWSSSTTNNDFWSDSGRFFFTNRVNLLSNTGGKNPTSSGTPNNLYYLANAIRRPERYYTLKVESDTSFNTVTFNTYIDLINSPVSHYYESSVFNTTNNEIIIPSIQTIQNSNWSNEACSYYHDQKYTDYKSIFETLNPLTGKVETVNSARYCWDGRGYDIGRMLKYFIFTTDTKTDISLMPISIGGFYGFPSSTYNGYVERPHATIPSGDNVNFYTMYHRYFISSEFVFNQQLNDVYISVYNTTTYNDDFYSRYRWDTVSSSTIYPSGNWYGLNSQNFSLMGVSSRDYNSNKGTNLPSNWIKLANTSNLVSPIVPVDPDNPIDDNNSINPTDIEVYLVKIDEKLLENNEKLDVIIEKLTEILGKMTDSGSGSGGGDTTINNNFTVEINNIFNNEVDKSIAVDIHDNTIVIKGYGDSIDNAIGDLDLEHEWNKQDISDLWYDPSNSNNVSIFGDVMDALTGNSLINTYLIGVLIIALIGAIL